MSRRKRPARAPADPIELVVLLPEADWARCREYGSSRTLTVQDHAVFERIPGDRFTLRQLASRRDRSGPVFTGQVEDLRFDATALGLTPLALHELLPWDPKKDFWRDPDAPHEDREKAIQDRGPRTCYEMERVVPRRLTASS